MVLITGASTGIGFATALRLHHLGWTVLAGVRKSEDGIQLKNSISTDADRMIPVILDVTSPAQILSARQFVLEKLKERKISLRALINNAGIVVPGPLEYLPLSDFRHQFDVNVFGLLEVTQTFLPELRKSQGRIVNMSSIAGRTVTPLMGAYCASKHGVEVISDSLRMELKNTGIQVCLIEPGSIDTPIWKKSLSQADDEPSHLPAMANKNYGSMMRSFQTLAKILAKSAEPVETVVHAIEHALTAKIPKTRYLVGKDAKRSLLTNLIPDRLRDSLILSVVNKYRNSTHPKAND
ncbi:MAG: short-chain dehydrogenase/reductase [Bdellovibrio sp. CG10_big_fil_rev_8_21_14_0_10_47_8]|nr:MAG: short-chain dehydrogenase/reductase [Bdellovibrio sp. CG10_big_fil_rev_8_21_14_0_10_47_8]